MIPYSTQWIEQDDVDAVAEVMRGTHLTQGAATPNFEKALAAYLGVKHVVAVSSGTAALHLLMLSLKESLCKTYGENTTVRGFVPPITFAATLNCFWYIDALAALVDVDAKTGQMTPATLEAALSKTPRAKDEKWIVVPVSLQGRPMDFVGLKAVADKYGAILVEDAAHAMSGFYNVEGKTFKMGSCGHTHAAIASFHSLKQLTLGEGGAVMTNDDALADKVRLLRSHGIVRPGRKTDPAWHYEQTELGFHYRISDIHCALGLSQLKKLDSRYARRQELAKKYDATLNQAPFNEHFWIVPGMEGHAYHLYKIHFKNEEIRNAAHEFLKTKGFFTQVLYTPLYRFPYHEKRLGKMSLPGAEEYFKGALAIPLFPKMTNDQQNEVVEALREFCFIQSKSNMTLTTEAGEYHASVKSIEKTERAR